eukprot:13178498-Heterocapsa_arctica.AAC.1
MLSSAIAMRSRLALISSPGRTSSPWRVRRLGAAFRACSHARFRPLTAISFLWLFSSMFSWL